MRVVIAPPEASDLMVAFRDVAGFPRRNGAVRDGRHERPNSHLDKQDACECYVYIVLPGATRFSTAGSFEIKQDRNGVPNGRFVYCRNYLDHPDTVPIDPVDLKSLTDTVYRTAAFNGVFSSLRDASPPQFGRRVIKLTSPAEPRSMIDYLILSPDDRAGAPTGTDRLLPPIA